ncbi:MAG: DUF1073 domain-containing protein [Desulfobulbaceae bacterium]|nr:DUF1073 domain-containing protein [Desulfobulbaceae bacterium]
MFKKLKAWFNPPVPPLPADNKPQKKGVTDNAVTELCAEEVNIAEMFRIPDVMPNTIPDGKGMAMDSAPISQLTQSPFYTMSGFEAPTFLGYAALTIISQDSMIRSGVETLADEMVRKWIKIHSTSEDEEAKVKIAEIDAALKKFKTEKRFRDAMSNTGYFGGCLLYMDFGDDTNTEAGKREVKTPLTFDDKKIGKGRFKGFTIIEPVNCYPAAGWNSINPLAPDYFKPQLWYVTGVGEVHGSRLLRFVQNEVSLLIRPTYNFFGIPMAQLALDFVEKFTTVRTAAADLVDKYSVSVLATDMSQVLSAEPGDTRGAKSLLNRIKSFVGLRHNRRVMVIDKAEEEFIQVNTPLSGVEEIVTKTFELVAAVFRLPVVKMLGISPSGFNATGESDTRNLYDYVKGQQEKIFRDNLEIALKVVQISEFGEIDESIGFEFEPLMETDPVQDAAIRKSDQETDCGYAAAGAISPEEIRSRIARDPKSGYNDIDVDDLPEQPEQSVEAFERENIGGIQL